MSGRASFTPDYFERLYRRDADPWRFTTSPYERTKYVATLAALEDRRFSTAFEVGCSVGIFTSLLAKRCDSLLAVDVSEIALNHARRNCRATDKIAFERMQIPAEWPAHALELIVLSEVLYFLNPADIRLTAYKSMKSLTSDGVVVLVNWTGGTDYPCSGNEAAEIFLSQSAEVLRPTLQRREQHYRLDVLTAS